MLIVNHLLMQWIFDECFNFVIIKKFGMEDNPVKIDNLSDDEHNALRNTAGYVSQNLNRGHS